MIRKIVKSLLFASALFAGLALAQELTMAASAQPETLDPHVTSATSSFQTMKSLYDTLVEVDRSGNIVPALASSWTVSDDALTWTFTLSEATFQDGTSFDSADVADTLTRLTAEETGSPKAGEFANIAGIETPDDRTVVLTLSEATPALLASLASGWGAMLPSEKIAAEHDFGNDPIGTGPFILDTWVRDSHLRLVRNEAYYQGAPALEAVTIRFVQDTAVSLQGLLAGEFDVVQTVSPADQETVEAAAGVDLIREPSGLVLVASINNRRPYLSDARVRQALNMAVDKETVLEVAYGGGQPVGTFMEVGSPWLPDSIQAYSFDPEAARATLAEAGVPSDWTLDLVLPQPFENHVTAGQVVQDMLGEVGVKSEIRVVEWGVWLGEVFRGERDFDLTVIGHTGKLDPTGRLGGYGAVDNTYVGYDNAEVVELLQQAASATDTEARRGLYGQVLAHMHDEAPFIYFGTPFRTHAKRGAVEGFWITPLLDTFDFREATLN
jgi:peptide/nickel transport system substrate-binding protein